MTTAVYSSLNKEALFNKIDTKQKHLALIICSLMVISLVPIWTVTLPPLVDYPNHLARTYIIANIDKSNILQTFYEINWGILPNLAMDIIIPPISKITGVENAGKIFISLILILLVTGTFVLHFVLHEKFSYWPLLSFLFLYNNILLWGYVNFLFGTGEALWLIAGWVYFSKTKQYKLLSLFFILNTLLFFTHIYPFGVFFICIAAYEFQNHYKNKIYSLKLICFKSILFAVPAILFFLGPTTPTSAHFRFMYRPIIQKFAKLFLPFDNYNIIFDTTTFLIIIALLVYAVIRRRIMFSKIFSWPLCALAAVYFLMPMYLLTGGDADIRIIVPSTFIFIAATGHTHVSGKSILKFMSLIGIIFILRLGMVMVEWQKADKIYASFFNSIEQVKPGESIATAIAFKKEGEWDPFPVPMAHLPCMAIIRREAFIPHLFAFPSQQPIRYTKKYAGYSKITPEPRNTGKNAHVYLLARDYNYLMIVNPPIFKSKISRIYKNLYLDDNIALYKTPVN